MGRDAFHAIETSPNANLPQNSATSEPGWRFLGSLLAGLRVVIPYLGFSAGSLELDPPPQGTQPRRQLAGLVRNLTKRIWVAYPKVPAGAWQYFLLTFVRRIFKPLVLTEELAPIL